MTDLHQRGTTRDDTAENGLQLESLTKILGGRTIVDRLEMTIGDGEFVSLLGPSGCGKTTTLRMIAGFLEPDSGRVLVHGADVTRLGPERRPSAMVFQNYALWPHMSVYKNVAFPLEVRRLPRDQIRQRVMAALETVNLTHHAKTRPAHISGGEQQRAALARAIVQEPQLLLLDEPLSNLDAKLRTRVRDELRDIQQRLGITTVLVTHDQDEALAVSDRVAVMNGGRIEQFSAPTALYTDPETRFVATFVGTMNMIDAPGLGREPSTDAEWAVRPEDVLVGAEREEGAVAARVVRTLPHGPFTELVIEAGRHVLRSTSASGARVPETGDDVFVRLRNVRCYRDGRLSHEGRAAAGTAASTANTTDARERDQNTEVPA